MLHYAAAFHPLGCGEQDDAFSAGDEVRGYGHWGALVGYFAAFGDYFCYEAGGVEEDLGAGAVVEGGHFAVRGEGGELGWGALVGCFGFKGKMGLGNWVYLRIVSMME